MIRRVLIQGSVLGAFLTVSACSASKEPASSALQKDELTPASNGRTLVVGRAPGGSYVMLEPQDGKEFPAATGPAFMDQSSQMFIPGEMVARTGQPVQFRSSEDVLHNVRVIRSEDRKPIFNVATPPWGSYSHIFEEPGIYDVTCDIHTTMRASILVSPSPYATIADGAGRFTFENVVPGTYTLVGFVEGRRKEQSVTISGSRTEIALR
jgi:plastocyanin